MDDLESRSIFKHLSKPLSSRSGLTLVELVIVVLILAIVAATGSARISSLSEDARVNAVASHLRNIEQAAQHFYVRHGRWPSDAPEGELPDDLAGMLPVSAFTERTPLGGLYDWNGEDMYGGVFAGISIHFKGEPFPVALCTRVDRLIDDGNLSTGKVRRWSGRVFQLELQPQP